MTPGFAGHMIPLRRWNTAAGGSPTSSQLSASSPRSDAAGSHASAENGKGPPRAVGQIPGTPASHGARYILDRAEPLSMPPQVGAGGGTPSPRKLSADSARMTAPTRVVKRTMTGAMMLGRM